MPRKVRIQSTEDEAIVFIGIASDERIWKLCHALNQLLGLNLLPLEPPDTPATQDKQSPDKTYQPLLLDMPAAPPDEQSYIYEDNQSHVPLEFVLCAGNRSTLPQEARPFSAFLVIHYPHLPFPGWNPDRLLPLLNQSDLILSAVDISHLKNINQILP
ncbi:MAG: hypothetical protein OHK0039_43920 [Bacteroidia bacterium]